MNAAPVVTGVVRCDLVSRDPDVAPMWPGSRVLERQVEPDQLERSDHRAPCFSEAQVAIQPDGADLLGGRLHDQGVVAVVPAPGDGGFGEAGADSLALALRDDPQAPTTSDIPSPPGWKTSAFQPG